MPVLLAADPGGAVLVVLVAKCAGCHSPAAKKVEKFDYITDLKRLAADPSKVVPGHPEKSDLWLLVNSGNMPPPPSRITLTASEKAIIRDWITAGAPMPLPPGPPPAPDDRRPDSSPEAPAGVSAPEGPYSPPRLLRWGGELHLLVLHFPIVCIWAALLEELRGAWRRRWRGPLDPADRGPFVPPVFPELAAPASPTVSFCLRIAALAAVPTVAAGWLYAASGHGQGQPDTLLWHRWLGTSGGILCVLTALLDWRFHDGRLRLALLVTTAAVVTVAAHFGGQLAFGRDFLAW